MQFQINVFLSKRPKEGTFDQFNASILIIIHLKIRFKVLVTPNFGVYNILLIN